jgi:hypothetical protein
VYASTAKPRNEHDVADDEIEYRYVKGKGWVPGYKRNNRILEPLTVRIETDANGWRYVTLRTAPLFTIEDDPEGGVTFVALDD